MDLGRYLLGAGELALVIGALGYGAARLRARLLADWAGAPARLAEIVLGVSALLLVLQLAGLAQLLDPLPIVLIGVAAGAAMAWFGAPLDGGSGDRRAPVPGMGGVATGVALAAVTLVAIHWATFAEHSFSIGLYGGDENWYHLPYPARFAQEGSITSLHYASPDYLSWFHPLNSELFHAMGMVLFGRDILSPFLNLVWLGVALLAAWCIGRPYGLAPLTATAAALALDLPVFVETQAGAAMSDLFGLTFVLCALALLVNARAGAERIPEAALVVVGLAAGLALGGKLSYAGPVVVLLAANILFAGKGSRVGTGLLVGLPALATGSFWYLRDFAYVWNPFPYVQELGPIDLPGPNQDLSEHPFSVAHYLFDGSVWGDYFVPGLREQIGPVWFLLIALMIGGIALAILQRRDRAVLTVGLVAAVAFAFYLLTPAAAEGPEGFPREFPAGLRVLEPALALGLIASALGAVRLGRRERWISLGVLALGVLVATKRGAEFWDGAGELAAAVLIAVFLILVPIGLLVLAGRGPHGPVLAALGAAAAAAIVIGVGWPRTQDYLDHRYRTDDAPSWFASLSLVPVYRWAQDEHDVRIATSGILQYGLYGADLSNRVQFLGEVGSDHGFREIETCAEWRTALNEGDYDYVVAMPRFGGTREIQARWTTGPGATPVLNSGPITVFRLTGDLDPSDCGTLPPL